MLTRLRQRLGDEQGSVLLAITVAAIGLLAIMAMTSAVLGGMDHARVDQARVGALQQASAGVDLALYRVDRRDFTGVTWVTNPSRFTQTVTDAHGGGFTIDVQQVTVGSDSNWTVRSTGRDSSGRQRLVIATVSTARLFPDALFSNGNFNLSGNQSLYSYNSSTDPTAASAVLATPTNPMPGALGSNGVLDGSAIAQFSDLWTGFNMYGRASQAEADAACVGCGGAPKVVAITDKLNRVPPPAPATALSCPSGGVIAGGIIQPGDYVCSSLNLSGTITDGIAGNSTGKVRIWVNGPFDSTATVNRFGRPQNFEILQATQADGTGYSGHGICRSDLWALLFTPGLVVNCSGGNQPAIHGAYIIDSYAGTGNQLTYYYDSQATTVNRDGTYGVSNWRECPVSATDC